MRDGKKSNSIIGCGLILLMIIFGVTTINCFAHMLDISIAVRLTLYMLFCILFPGYTICCLLKIEDKKDVLVLAYSLGLGYSISIIEYLILMPLKLGAFFPAVAAIVALICIIYLVKNKIFNNKVSLIPSSLFFLCTLFLLVILVLEYYTVSMVNTLPGETPMGNLFHSDLLYWVGNNITATRGFPLQDFRQVGYEYNYHYFSSLFIAQMSMVTGIDVVVLSLYFSSIFAGCLLIYGLYALLSNVIDKSILIVLGYLFFVTADGKYTSFETHLFYMPFGFDYGMAMGMLAVSTLFLLKKGKVTKVSGCILSAIFLGICTGSKGPIGAIVLVGFGVFSLLLLFKKEWGKAFIWGGIWLGTFLMVYCIFISGTYTSVGPSLDYVGMIGALNENPYVHSVISEYTVLDRLATIPKVMTVIPLYLFKSSYASNILWCLSIVAMAVMIIKKNKEWYNFLILNIIVLVGNVLGIMFIQRGGGSQIYFIMAAMPFALTAGLLAIQNLYGRRVVVVTVLIAALALLVFQYKRCAPKHRGRIELGISIANKVGMSWEPTGMYCNNAQYDTYCWIRDNTDVDSIIAIDNFGSADDFNNQRTLAGVLSERYVWNEDLVFFKEEAARRNEILNSISVLDDESIRRLQDEGVIYYLQNKQYSSEDINTSSYVNIVFDNESYRVYQIQ